MGCFTFDFKRVTNARWVIISSFTVVLISSSIDTSFLHYDVTVAAMNGFTVAVGFHCCSLRWFLFCLIYLKVYD